MVYLTNTLKFTDEELDMLSASIDEIVDDASEYINGGEDDLFIILLNIQKKIDNVIEKRNKPVSAPATKRIPASRFTGII